MSDGCRQVICSSPHRLPGSQYATEATASTFFIDDPGFDAIGLPVDRATGADSMGDLCRPQIDHLARSLAVILAAWWRRRANDSSSRRGQSTGSADPLLRSWNHG